MAQAQGIELRQDIVEDLGFGSAEAMRIQLGNWDVPDWVTQGEPQAEKPKSPKPAPAVRKARSSGPVVELPSAVEAAPLFREKLEALMRGNEELQHRKEKLQGGRFFQSSVHTDPILFSRKDFSDERWEYFRELYDLDADAKSFMHFGGVTFRLGGGTPAPQAPLPSLIATYILMEGQVGPLLDALYPGTPTEEVLEKIRKRIDGKKGTNGLDGLKVLVQQLATLIRGGDLGKGRDPADIPRDDFNLACCMTERRDAQTPEEKIYKELRHLPRSEELTWDEFERLRDLELRWPWAQQ